MLFNVSYKNKEIEAQIKTIVGSSFGLIERLKWKGIGSQRLIVKTQNEEISHLLDAQTASNLCTIELRKKGLVIWFRIRLDNWVLALPYRGLVLYKSTNLLTLHSTKWKLHFSPAHNAVLKLSFIKKIMRLRNQKQWI